MNNWICGYCGRNFDKPVQMQEACDCCTGFNECPYCGRQDVNERVQISKSALKSIGFKAYIKEDTTFWHLPIADKKEGGLYFLESSDDLCIELSPCVNDSGVGWWYCWITQVEPNRHIHIRHLRFIDEIELLFLGLVGVSIHGN